MKKAVVEFEGFLTNETEETYAPLSYVVEPNIKNIGVLAELIDSGVEVYILSSRPLDAASKGTVYKSATIGWLIQNGLTRSQAKALNFVYLDGLPPLCDFYSSRPRK